MSDLYTIWVYLSASPLVHLTMTLVVYQLFDAAYKRAGYNPFLNPVLYSVAAIIAILALSHTSYETYFNGAQFVHFLLGPAVVALAIPLYRAYAHIRRSALAIGGALLLGGVFAIISAVGIALALGASTTTVLSMAPKSATTPIAMGVAEEIGAVPSLTAVFVILTGIIGAVSSRPVFDLFGIHDKRARGFATGLVAHGIGTAHKLRIHELTGAFSGLAMCLNGIATTLLVPVVIRLLQQFHIF